MIPDMRPIVLLVVTLFGLWLVWSGHYTLDVEQHPQILVLGLLSVAGVTLLCRRLGIVDDDTAPPQYSGRAALYWIWLARQSIISSLNVMRVILAPRASDVPRAVRVTPSQENDLFRVTYANSITLTPGTVTILATDDEFLVHALTPENSAGLRSGEMDRRVRRFETGRAPEEGDGETS